MVLHGPNRTGKSSLVLALRCCLFDCDHDTAGKEIKNSIPWGGNGPPKVVVEFTTGGVDYRLTKVFSKKKEGTGPPGKEGVRAGRSSRMPRKKPHAGPGNCSEPTNPRPA